MAPGALLANASPTLVNRAAYFASLVRRSGFVAHHGLQRSGTNYLNACLKSLQLYPLNTRDLPGGDPRSKHFRWQHDKATVPAILASQYSNDRIVRDVEELNRQAAYPRRCRHVVMRKHLRAWLVSIMNWGLACQWFQSRHEALQRQADFADDYRAYYGFWQDLAIAHPGSVVVVDYEELWQQPPRLIAIVRRLGLRPRRLDAFTGRFEEVPRSPEGRLASITMADLTTDGGKAEGCPSA